MTYRIQIITAKGEPVLNARVWSQRDFEGMASLFYSEPHATRWKEPDDRRWRYMIAGQRVQSTKELTEAFRGAGMFEKGEK